MALLVSLLIRQVRDTAGRAVLPVSAFVCKVRDSDRRLWLLDGPFAERGRHSCVRPLQVVNAMVYPLRLVAQGLKWVFCCISMVRESAHVVSAPYVSMSTRIGPGLSLRSFSQPLFLPRR